MIRIGSRGSWLPLLVTGAVPAAGFVYIIFADLHRWQDRVFAAGALACFWSVGFQMHRMRRHRDVLMMVVFAVTLLILAVMVGIDSYSTRYHLVTGAVMFAAGLVGAAIAGVREYWTRPGRDVPEEH